MSTIRAVNNLVLDIDLTSGKIGQIKISDKDRRQYLGGKGLALKLLYDHIKSKIDPLSPDNILVMMTGPTAGTSAPAGGRFTVVSKSPLTGIFASSYVGGRFGVSLKRSGYDGIMVRGKSETPVYISISEERVSIKDASSYWGTDSYEFQEKLKDEGHWAVIGPAGENKVRYAGIVAGRRLAARCGLGAVMGSKNLKGIAANGKKRIVATKPDLFKTSLKIAQEKVKSHPNTGQDLPKYGTPLMVMVYGNAGIMPVRNYSKPYFDKAENISGEKTREKYFVKNHGCVGCSIQCGKIGKFNDKEKILPEYETLSQMGANLEIDDISKIVDWNEKLNRLGMDSISTGNTLGYVMEMTEKGLLDSNLTFGKPENISAALDDIAFRRGLGDDMAEGVKRMSKKYGGNDFAIHVKGLELPAYDPRGCTGQGLGFATANCGATHLSGATHAIEVASYLDPQGTAGKAYMVKFLQDIGDVVNSALFCVQVQHPFLAGDLSAAAPLEEIRQLMQTQPEVVTQQMGLTDFCSLTSALLSYDINRDQFYEIGERIFNLERLMNCREGINRTDDTLPVRLLKEDLKQGWAPIELEKMLDEYYELRGWDNNGQPKEEVLKRLDIS